MSGSMEIIIGKPVGYCNGVKYAIEQAERLIENNKIYCIGKLIHNEMIISVLESKGLIFVNSIDEIPCNSSMIIRAHGAEKNIYEKAKGKNITIIDLTCGKIKAINLKTQKKKAEYFIVIVGKKNHPEAKCERSFLGEDAEIVESIDDIDRLIERFNNSTKKKIYIVSQTTFNSAKFDEIVKIIKQRVNSQVEVDKTICNETEKRQSDVNRISKKADTVIVVGGRDSSNTKETKEVASRNCKNVYLIQDVNELVNSNIEIKGKVGLISGTSTPRIEIDKITRYLNSYDKNVDNI